MLFFLSILFFLSMLFFLSFNAFFFSMLYFFDALSFPAFFLSMVSLLSSVSQSLRVHMAIRCCIIRTITDGFATVETSWGWAVVAAVRWRLTPPTSRGIDAWLATTISAKNATRCESISWKAPIRWRSSCPKPAEKVIKSQPFGKKTRLSVVRCPMATS